MKGLPQEVAIKQTNMFKKVKWEAEAQFRTSHHSLRLEAETHTLRCKIRLFFPKE